MHQRAALAGARSASVEDSVKHLPTLLKPGGWIQLMELDLTATDADGPAVRDFNKLVRVLMEKGGSGDAHCLPGSKRIPSR